VSRIDSTRLGDLQDVLGEVRTWAGVDDRGGDTLRGSVYFLWAARFVGANPDSYA
jgi:hypothetical protein